MYVAETDSTNNLLKASVNAGAAWLAEARVPAVWTGFQTAGRGQAGNGWESERGKNLTCSLLLREPQVAIERQFLLSMLAAVALRETVCTLLGGSPEELTIKWPNDLYWKDGKLAGMLIENNIAGGRIAHSIVGIGLNINQRVWVGSAPNPTSLGLITGRTFDVEQVLEVLVKKLEEWQEVPQARWRETYMAHLYRREGLHPFVERAVSLVPTADATGAEAGVFRASIQGVADNGELLLRREDGTTHAYHFKEIRYVLERDGKQK